MKYLTFFFSYVVGKYSTLLKPNTELLTADLILKVRKMAFLFSLLLLGAIGMSLTTIKILETLVMRFDQNMAVTMDGAISIFLFGFVVFLSVFLYALSKKEWLRSPVTQKPLQPVQRQGSPLEEAIALLISDFAKERQIKRTEKYSYVNDEMIRRPASVETSERERERAANHINSYEEASHAARQGFQPPPV